VGTPSQVAAAAAAAAAAIAAARLPATPRLRTRMFAVQLLLSLFSAVGPHPGHRLPVPKYDDSQLLKQPRPDQHNASSTAWPAEDQQGAPGRTR
jgi:hypothetical protein